MTHWHIRPQFWTSLAIEYAVITVSLFVSAGHMAWATGWLFIGLFATLNTYLCLKLEWRDPALFDERLNMFHPRGQPVWDRVIFSILMALILLWLVSAGVEVGRFHQSYLPLAVQLIGTAFMLLGLYGSFAVMAHNPFLAPTVRIQSERQHHLVSDGPYSIVRHPFYTMLILHFMGGSIMLGSLWSFGVACLIGILFAYRSAREEAFLMDHLEGYDAYRHRVRYRLVPYIW